MVLFALASPMLKVRLGLAGAGTAPKGETIRTAYELLSGPGGFGPGFRSPMAVVVDLQSEHQATAPKGETIRTAYDLLSGPGGFGAGYTSPIPVVVDLQYDHQAAAHIQQAMKQVPGIAHVEKPIYNSKTPDLATVAIVNAYSKYSPQDVKTVAIASTLRDTTIPQTLQRSAAHAYVSGQNAAFADIGNKILSNAPWFLLYVIGVTFLVLTMAFRSIVIA